MRRLFPIGVCSLFLIFVGCATTPPVCQPEGARQAGFNSAMRGENYNEAVGGVCKDEQVNVFKTNFNAGYQQGKQQHCDAAQNDKLGESHAQAGGTNQFNEATYGICPATASLKKAYNRGYDRGLAEFCSDAKAAAAGEAQGVQGAANAYSDGNYSVCPKVKLGRIRNSYDRGHKKGLAKFCTTDEVNTKGVSDGTQGAAMMDVDTRYKECASAKRKEIVAAYVASYDRGMVQYCAAPNIEAEAIGQAKTTPAMALPAKFNGCWERYPNLKDTYQAAFNAERGRVIASRCTHPAGLEAGKADAASSNNRNTNMPDYCDAAHFQHYLNGYLDGWKQTKDRLCDVVAAFQLGLSQGQGGQPLSYNPPAQCPAEYEGIMRQKFTEGYQQGLTMRPKTSG